MTRLPQLIDKLEHCSFSEMKFTTVRDVSREIIRTGATADSVQNALESLSDTQRDTLMKVLYCCLEHDCRNSSTYLQWHATLYSMTGSGAIMRVLTDKKRSHEMST
ncbi:putative ARP2 3 complex 16 kDa subunit (p16 Arc) [Trypanosoma vivax]|uniref:Actin-related protein 2/3 complex subunit 5 n=1 Tax=Trypanosoma vivax (strain Y486) TaxID=1055687 RepID=G0U7Y3_TRYVY|nr:putative ARP2/3 complex 16kDa subunit [Trypanosoma vivax]KAH8606285.1 putative ARP2 3 complex 16 kDa subunit (p16 Arc) [Trypanosoma vivax]CCC51991.1 putative ARP2/3 complex 16kDa subunit [Trypanosoma vivax Y486]